MKNTQLQETIDKALQQFYKDNPELKIIILAINLKKKILGAGTNLDPQLEQSIIADYLQMLISKQKPFYLDIRNVPKKNHD